MPPEPDNWRVQHMLDAAREAIAFCEARSFESFAGDRQVQLAVVKTLEIVGEAASHVSLGTRAQLASVPWPRIVTMRHRLVHAYFEIDVAIVWDTVTLDLPSLVAALQAWLAEHS